jgi:hypothetical protein
MGDGKKGVLRVAFDKRIKLEFHGAKITSDGGLLLYRELDEALGLTELSEAVLEDNRTGKNTRHKITPLLRQSIYSRLAGYEDTNDADRLRVDPERGGQARERLAASASEVGRFETEILTSDENLAALTGLSGECAQRRQLACRTTNRWWRDTETGC